MKKIRRTLKAGMAWWIQLKFGIGGAPPRGNCTENFVCFCSGSFELQMHENSVFLAPVKYTLVCRTPKFSWFLGSHDALLCVLI